MNRCPDLAAILISRQPLRPSRRFAWVRQAEQAVVWLKHQQMALCSSLGLQTWELVTALGSIHGLPMRIVPGPIVADDFDACRRHAFEQFDLDPDRAEFAGLPHPGPKTRRQKVMQDRDVRVVETATVLLPISLRPDGGMERLVDESKANGKQIETRFAVPYQARSEKLAYDLSGRRLNPMLAAASGRWLVHWTRSFNAAWPGERAIDYYRAVLASDTYPRTAFASLENILRTQTIYASSTHMPEKTATVSFSAVAPQDLIRLVKWRSRHRRMAFEPYGVGIKRARAAALGIKPVSYYRRGEGGRSKTGETWLRQSRGVITDWRREQEYRRCGDFDLSAVAPEDMCAFCLTAEEALMIERDSGIRAVSFLP
jgi:hypothetical protein